ncbi:MAG TPA: MFS transporter [Micropepsaceae bacterium]|nr:MFS transporter [Micropepsaceae bacterium]
MSDRVFIKCAWRLVPFIAVLYLFNRLDRTNVAFASLTMNRDLHLSPSVYGFGAGLFFAGYALFQLPSNLILERIGTRAWIFLILAIWGAISAANAFIQGPESFYALRFSLGLAEAGLFPGMVLYLSYWFPHAYRARFLAGFLAALPVANIIGGPLSGLVLGMEGVLGLHGWQWLFLIEGLPACALALLVPKMMPADPKTAPWLDDKERQTIAARLQAEDRGRAHELLPALKDPHVLTLAVVYFAFEIGFGSLTVWLPQMVQSEGFTPRTTTLLVALPYAAAVPAMILWSKASDRNGERVRHIALAAFFVALGFGFASFTQFSSLMLFGLALAVVGAEAFLPVFFSLPSSFLKGPAAAGGIALISCIGNVGGFLGPTVVGQLKEATESYAPAMALLAGSALLAGIIVLALGRAMSPRAKMAKSTG